MNKSTSLERKRPFADWSTNYTVQWKWNDWDFLSPKNPLSFSPLGWSDTQATSHRTRLRSGEKMAKTDWKDIISEQRESSRGLGRGKGPFSPDVWSACFAPRFFWPFSPTAELGPRLECLNPPRKTAWEANFHRKYSPNKWNNDTRGQEGDNHVYFGACSLSNFISIPVAIRILTQQKVTAFIRIWTKRAWNYFLISLVTIWLQSY